MADPSPAAASKCNRYCNGCPVTASTMDELLRGRVAKRGPGPTARIPQSSLGMGGGSGDFDGDADCGGMDTRVVQQGEHASRGVSS